MKHTTFRASALLVAGPALAVCSFAADPALADRAVIKNPGQHPQYSFEAEPHLAIGLFDFGPADDGFGAGFRGTIVIVDNGFVSSINNSVGIGFGLDWVHYEHEHCRPGPGRGAAVVCDEHDDFSLLWVPVVMQWNFWLSENWSVFGEPGLSIRLNDRDYYDDDIDIDPTLYLGGRFRLTDGVHLTMRLGHPTFTLGVSFLL
jgi:hypothetical protein